jgi:nucleoside phosphorylase/CheY-like chemotaxis protein
VNLNVLIVDDDSYKCTAISNQLHLLGINENFITIASDASQARHALNEKSFDIMLLDVLLPARKDGKPLANVSIDFLSQIIEDHTTPAPTHILGITADPSALAQCQEEFQRLTSQILHVDPTQDEWRQSLQLLIERIHSSFDAKKSYDYDICFQTALRIPELDAIVNHLPIKWGVEEYLSKGILCRKGDMTINGKTYRLVCAHASQMGLVAATHLAALLIREFRPRLLGMSGICGGIASNVQIGDVIIAEKSWDWQSGKWDSSGELLSAVDQKDASTELVVHARGVNEHIANFYNEYTETKPNNIPQLHVGPMISGSSVVADQNLHKLFKQQHRKLIAVDMECYGLYYAVAMAPDPSPKVLCVKSVSDLANQQKSDDYQQFCSYISAKTLFATIERYLT